MNTLWILLAILAVAFGKVIFSETFDSENWKQRWNKSEWRAAQQADFVHTGGKLDPGNFSKGLLTTTDMKYYVLSSKLPINIYLNSTPLVLQYSIKFEESVICGGAYIKLLKPDFNPSKFGLETPALVTFGPEVCGTNNRIHILLDSNGRGEIWRKSPKAPTDKSTHFFTLALYPDGTYSLYVNCKIESKGKISEEWALEDPSTVKDFVVGGVGIAVRQTKTGTLFDNILVTDSLKEALDVADKFISTYKQKELEVAQKAEKKEIEQENEYKRIREKRGEMHVTDLQFLVNECVKCCNTQGK
eukprot:TRINITY_DN71095_c2_g1_i1.p2 TRINITY_DN71095_c2_g1~~TRINITY_DN71095_c2_g1_i1.p2  ORF type:complete len:319 (+),score=24.74 TRINITY_DN71095_c2_g1_i1:53-958(+)